MGSTGGTLGQAVAPGSNRASHASAQRRRRRSVGCMSSTPVEAVVHAPAWSSSYLRRKGYRSSAAPSGAGWGTGGGTLSLVGRKCPAALGSGRAVDAAGSRCSATTRRACHLPRRVSRSAWERRSSSRSTRSSASTAARTSGSACPSIGTNATALAGIAPSSDTRSSRVSGVARTSRGRTAGRITRLGNSCSARRRPAPARVTALDRRSRLNREPNRHPAERHGTLPRRAPSRSRPPATVPRLAKSPPVQKALAAAFAIRIT